MSSAIGEAHETDTVDRLLRTWKVASWLAVPAGSPKPTTEESAMTQASSTAETRPVMLTLGEAADELAVTERFIRKLISNGQLRAVTVGTRVVRIRRTDLEDLLRPARVVPQLGRR
jgi:excisionase family DNA binding protein